LSKTAAIYLAHLNPVTKSHSNIISRLCKSYQVYLFPVRFVNRSRELNTRSFPFSFEARKSMVEELFGDSVKLCSTYTFRAPFLRYLPPLISPSSWTMRKKILECIVENEFFSYTGDRAESWMLKLYGLRPMLGKRLEISGTFVRELLYRDASGYNKGKSEGKRPWHEYVPPQVIEIIYKNWAKVEQYANAEDMTVKLFGMKFPQEGLLSP
jgi:hypothetical protein